MKTKTWICLLAGLFLLCLLLAFLPRGSAAYAQVASYGRVVQLVELRFDQSFTVSTPEGGENTVTVRNGKISVTHASCPDGYCMAQGERSSGQIVCLPNRLVISFPKQAVLDAVSG